MSQEPNLDLSGGATQESTVIGQDFAHSYLELQVLSAAQQEFRLPFQHDEIDLVRQAPTAFPSGRLCIARLRGEEVELECGDGGGPLVVGASFEFDGARICLLDARLPPVGTLVGLSAPYAGKVWSLTNQQTWLGRKGKRLNHVEINHSTVSRTHLTLSADARGQVRLLAESSSTSVNGQNLAAGEARALSNGALLGCGDLLFRFTATARSGQGDSLLNVRTLGTFSVTLGGQQCAPRIKNDKAQFLLAALAMAWGDPISVDWVLGEFWPDAPLPRARKNFSYTMVQLKENLGIKDSEGDNLFLRAGSTVQLNPERLGEHDYVELSRLTRSRRALTSRATLEAVLALYGGRFMANCYEDWAVQANSTLENDLTETLMATARYYQEQDDFSTLQLATGKLLALDPLNEEAASLQIEGALRAVRPDVALATYERLVEDLKAEGLEPSTDVLEIYQNQSSRRRN